MSSALKLLAEARKLGLLGPAPLDLHHRHALGFADALRQVGGNRFATDGLATRILDLGSGGGVPGIVLAEVWPKASIELLDGSERRCRLLEQWLLEDGWSPRVSVLCGRAEDLGRDPSLRGAFDAVVARLFGRPAVTAECAAPFLKVGGWLVASDPPSQSLDTGTDGRGSRWPPEGLALLGLEPDVVVAQPFHFTVLRQDRICPARYPRRTGVPAKRPLF